MLSITLFSKIETKKKKIIIKNKNGKQINQLNIYKKKKKKQYCNKNKTNKKKIN